MKIYFTKLDGYIQSQGLKKNWNSAHILQALDIATPTPIAYAEKRFGCIRGEAIYIAAYVQGQCLSEYLPNSPPPVQDSLVRQIVCLLNTLHQNGFVHGDMKCTNLLVFQDKIYFLDLDAMHYATFRKKHKIAKDRNRMLKNWLAYPRLLALFKKAWKLP